MAKIRTILDWAFCAVCIIIGTLCLACCDNTPKVEPFAFKGEAIDHPANFDKDTIVTSENIESLYRLFKLDTLFNGDYYLVRSKTYYETSRYLSRLIRMKDGKQVAAQTFYDSEIELDNIVRLGKRLVVGLNSLRKNFYERTFCYTSNKCRIIILSDNLTPIKGKSFYSDEKHVYIETLMLDSDSTFYCSVASGFVNIKPYSLFQFRADKDFNIQEKTNKDSYVEYQIKNDELNLFKPDWPNDISDEELIKMREENVRKDSISLYNKFFEKRDSQKSIVIESQKLNTPVVKQSIPQDFVLVPSGILKNECEWDSDKEIIYNVDIDSFYVCKFELTQAEYKRIIGSILPENYTWNIQIDYKDSKVVQQGDLIPVICTYQEFVEYCNKRSRLEGYDGFYDIEGNKIKIRHNGNGYRLLNHFEWTYAAKGGNSNEGYSYAGSNKIGEVAWYGGNSKYHPHEVGKKKPNSLGIYDMSGNVSEMLLDDPKSPYRLIGGEGFEYWVNLGPTDILGMFEKNRRNGTRVALVPKGMKNNNTKLTWKYKW